MTSPLSIGLIVALSVAIFLIIWQATRPRVLSTQEFPPVARRALRWWIIASTLISASAVAWIILRRPLNIPRTGWFRYFPFALGLSPIFIVTPIYMWRTAWLRRKLAETNNQLCTHCAYNVSGLPKSGTCPECGNPYDTKADQTQWQAFKGRKNQNPKDKP